MGCDIHTYREVFKDGKWESADIWEAYDYGEDDKGESVPYEKQAYTGRSYDLFGLLAGVRRDFSCSLAPRGLPFDVSEKVQAAADIWDGDGHNHSYLYLHELKALWEMTKAKTMPVSGMMDPEQWGALHATIESGNPDWNLLYPYCQWTSREDAVRFALDFPMEFLVGSQLDKMIAAFDGIEGDNHRLVFWFDN